MGARMDAEGGNLPLPSDTHSEPVSVPSQYDKPHIPEHCRAALAIANADKPLAQLAGNAEPILSRLRNGEKIMEIATDIGVSDVALYGFLLRHAPTEWLELSAGRSLSRLDKAASDLDTAADQITISRARESARLAQWDLERANRKLYGDNKADAGGVIVQVLIAPEGGEMQARVIEAER